MFACKYIYKSYCSGNYCNNTELNEVSCLDAHWDIVHPFSIKSNYLLLAKFL